MRSRITSVLSGVLLATAAWTSAPAAEPVTITVTDKVLVQDTTRIGINLCSDNYWDMAWEWNKQPEFVDYGPLPTIRSYAFKDGKMRGLILVNFDTTAAHTVKLTLPAKVANKAAKAWRLAADSIAANNEYETGEPQVKIAEETINNFSSGSEIKLPPHSMLVLKWQSRN